MKGMEERKAKLGVRQAECFASITGALCMQGEPMSARRCRGLFSTSLSVLEFHEARQSCSLSSELASTAHCFAYDYIHCPATTPPFQHCGRVALFCIASKKPSAAWLLQACRHAKFECDAPLEVVTKDEVDTTGWTLQQVAEWVVEYIAVEKDDRACLSFAVADHQSEATDSLVIVTILPSSFETQDTTGKTEDLAVENPETPASGGQEALENHDKQEEKGKTDLQIEEVKKEQKVVIERAFRASPEYSGHIPWLIQSGIRGAWDYETDDPDDPDAIYSYEPTDVEQGAAWQEDEDPQDYFDEEGELLQVTKAYVELCYAGGPDPDMFEQGTYPCYRLADGRFLSTLKVFGEDAFNKKPLPQINLDGEVVTVLGRYQPVGSRM